MPDWSVECRQHATPAIRLTKNLRRGPEGALVAVDVGERAEPVVFQFESQS
jgi:hypothetical protein